MGITTETEGQLSTDRLGRTVRMLREAIDQISDRLKTEDKGSYSDLVRLIELQKELEDQEETEAIREIIVTWIDPEGTESASAE